MSFAGALFTAASVAGAAVIHPSASAIAVAALVANAATLAVGTIVMARYAATNPIELAVHIARPFAAAGLMYAGVALAAPATGIVPVDLFVAIAFGVALYPLLLMLIWRLTGSPEGAETEALRVATTAANELGERLRSKRQPL